MQKNYYFATITSMKNMKQMINLKFDTNEKYEPQEILSVSALTLNNTANLPSVGIPNLESKKIFKEVRKGKNVNDFSFDELKLNSDNKMIKN